MQIVGVCHSSCLNEKSCSGKIRISKLETRNKFEYQMTKGMVND
jgi:hypothetical protein